MNKKLFDMTETELQDYEASTTKKYIAVLHSTNNIIAEGDTHEEVGRNAAPYWPAGDLVAPYYITTTDSFQGN